MDRDKDWEAFWDGNPDAQFVQNPMQVARSVPSPVLAQAAPSAPARAVVSANTRQSTPMSYEHTHNSDLHSLLDPPRRGRKTRLSDREKQDHSLSSVIMFMVGIVGLAGYMLWMIGNAT
ncbi:MAG: hypothetical protein Alpg2KO_19680 [Alphaproteobacteria bacterium]